MASDRLTTAVGRIVMGDLYKGNTTDAEGKPLTIKTGPNAGQSRVNFFFALAIPKGTEQHWAHTTWGAIIWRKGHEAFPQAAQSPAFAWKIEDGDSTVPNKKGKKPCDNEGWAGHWVVKFSGGYSPKVYRQDGAGFVQVTDEGYIKPGYYVEVSGNVDGNGSQSQPGVYLNHSMVCFRAFGPEINFGPNVNDAGFGQSALPAGASLTPPPSAFPMPAAPQTAPSVPAAVPAPTASVSPNPALLQGASAVPVTPNPAFLQVPPNPSPSPATAAVVAAPAVPTTPPVPTPVSPSKQMTAKAGGASYESFIAGGWSEAQMIAQGYLTAF